MAKVFNVNGACNPKRHYMVDLQPRLAKIRKMVDAGAYFTINKARQYGKTTTLRALTDFLREDYEVVSLDFQKMSSLSFESEPFFAASFAEELLDFVKTFPTGIAEKLKAFAEGTARISSLQALFKVLRLWCRQSAKQIILIIDEVDTATNHQVFLDFLSQLRAAYLDRDAAPAFQSVILAGVYDVRNIKSKIHPDEEHKVNSPWNIAADFLVDMGFSPEDIAGMLWQYEDDYHTGMDVEAMSHCLYDYTSGYPYLVSRLCMLMDERIAGSPEFPVKGSAWTRAGFFEAEKMLVKENNTLYQSLIGKLASYPELKTVLYELLFSGKPIPYISTNSYIEIAAMFGFIKNVEDTAVISNRIFETVLYNFFLSEEFATSRMYDAGTQERNQFIVGGHLDVRRVLEKIS